MRNGRSSAGSTTPSYTISQYRVKIETATIQPHRYMTVWNQPLNTPAPSIESSFFFAFFVALPLREELSGAPIAVRSAVARRASSTGEPDTSRYSSAAFSFLMGTG